MSLRKVMSPIYDDGTTVSSAVAAISQIYFSVQRDDNNGSGYIISNDGGKMRIVWIVYPPDLSGGDLFFIEKDGVLNDSPTYQGLHKLVTENAVGDWTTSTDYVDTDNSGFCTFKNNDIYTLGIFLQTEFTDFQGETIQYKIPFNNPIFNFNISEAVRPIFSAKQITYFELQATLSAVDSFGNVQSGSAIASYGIQCFAAQLKGGNEYGANLVGRVLRTTILGEILSQFEEPKVYDNKDVPFYYYGDVDFGDAIFNWQFITKSGAEWGLLNQTVFSFGGFGINIVPQIINTFPIEGYSVDVWISETGVGEPQLTEKKNYKLATTCSNEIIMSWLNEYGGLETYAFDFDNEARQENDQGIKYITGGVNDLKDNVWKRGQIWGDNIQSYQISLKGLSRMDLNIVQQILLSPVVFIKTGNSNPALDNLRVDVTGGFTIPYRVAQKKEHDFICTITLEDNQQYLPEIIEGI